MVLLAHFIEVFVRFRAVKILPFIHTLTCTHSAFVTYLSAAALGLAAQGLSLIAGCRLLAAVAALVAGRRLQVPVFSF